MRAAAPKKVIKRRLSKIAAGTSSNKNPAATTKAIKSNAGLPKVAKHADKKALGGFTSRAIKGHTPASLAASGVQAAALTMGTGGIKTIASAKSAIDVGANASKSFKKINNRYNRNIGLTKRELSMKPMQGMPR